MASRPAPGCSTRTVLQLVGAHTWTAVPAVLRYDPAEPFAVRVVFGGTEAPDGGEPDGGVEWLMSRDLLRAGLGRPAGDGDVRLWPARGDGDSLFLHLRAPSGEALFEASLPTVAGFLADTEDLVPRGAEAGLLRVDAELEALLHPDGTDPGGTGTANPRTSP